MMTRSQFGFAAVGLALVVLLGLSGFEIARLRGQIAAQERGMAELRSDLSAAVTDAADLRAELQNRVNRRSVDAEEITKRLLHSRVRSQEGRNGGGMRDGNSPSRAYQEQVRTQGA